MHVEPPKLETPLYKRLSPILQFIDDNSSASFADRVRKLSKWESNKPQEFIPDIADICLLSVNTPRYHSYCVQCGFNSYFCSVN